MTRTPPNHQSKPAFFVGGGWVLISPLWGAMVLFLAFPLDRAGKWVCLVVALEPFWGVLHVVSGEVLGETHLRPLALAMFCII